MGKGREWEGRREEVGNSHFSLESVVMEQLLQTDMILRLHPRLIFKSQLQGTGHQVGAGPKSLPQRECG